MTKDEAIQKILSAKQSVVDQLTALTCPATTSNITLALAALSVMNEAVEALIEAK